MEGPKSARAAESAYVALILAVAALFWREASRLAPAPYDPLGPKSFPMAVSALLGALGIVMFVRLVFRLPLGSATQSMVLGFEGARQHIRRPAVAVATLTLALLYASALSFRAIPFVVATTVYLFAAGLVLGPIRWRRVAGVAAFAAGAAIALDFIFRGIFRLDLS